MIPAAAAAITTSKPQALTPLLIISFLYVTFKFRDKERLVIRLDQDDAGDLLDTAGPG